MGMSTIETIEDILKDTPTHELIHDVLPVTIETIVEQLTEKSKNPNPDDTTDYAGQIAWWENMRNMIEAGPDV